MLVKVGDFHKRDQQVAKILFSLMKIQDVYFKQDTSSLS